MVSRKRMLRILEKGDIDLIHGATVEVLEKVGVYVNSDRALQLLADNGFAVDRGAKIAKMTESQVMDAVKRCKKNFRWHARSERYSVDAVDGRTKIGPGAQCLYYIDPETGGVRPPTLEDGITICRLLDALPSASIAYVPVQLSDISEEHNFIVQMAAGAIHSGKLTFGGNGRAHFEITLRLAEALLGDMDQVRKKPMFAGYVDPISPLAHDEAMVETMLLYAKWGFPVFITVMALGGGTAPASLAGLLVQQNAEVLSAIAIAACVAKSLKVVYGSVSCPLDMRSGMAATGSPESSLIGVGAVQMAKYYGIPSNMGVQSDSKTVDAQTSYEKAQAALVAMLAGADFSDLFLGSTEAFSAWSPVQAVIDDEIAARASRIADGIEVDRATISVDVIAKTGPMGNFLKNIETLRQFKREHLSPRLSDRASRAGWNSAGAKEMRQRAKERMIELLNSHSPDPLETEVRKNIDSLLKEYTKSIGADVLEKRSC